MIERQNFKEFFTIYKKEGLKPIKCKGYHPRYNPDKDYKTAKEPLDKVFTDDDFPGLSLQESERWVKTGGWIGWLIPKGFVVIDVEDKESIEHIKSLCKTLGIKPSEHNTNKGKHFFFKSEQNLSAASKVFTKYGLKVTYRIGGKNYLILAPTNGRTWEVPL